MVYTQYDDICEFMFVLIRSTYCISHAFFSAISSYQCFYFHKYDMCLPLWLTLTDMLTFFSVPLNPLTSSASLDQLVEYEPFIKTLYLS